MTATTLKLTTVFAPPTTCLQSVFTLSPYGFDVFKSGTVTRGIAPQCFPPGFRSVHEHGTISGSQSVFVDGVFVDGSSTSYGVDSTTYQSYYSPGICPSGYATGTSRYTSSTWFATCCPSGYDLSVLSTTRRYPCTHAILADYMTLILGETSYSTLPYVAVAPAVNIAYRAEDQATSVTSTAEPSSSAETDPSAASPVATSAAPTPTTSVSTQTTAPINHGLSSGAQAGIGVGISLVVILLAVGAGLLWKRSSRRRQREPSQLQFEKAELPGDSRVAGRYADAELAAEDTTVHEASNEAARPLEMDGMNTRAELPGDWIGVQAPGPEEQRSPS